MRGISTREYHEVLTKMLETVGFLRSAVSRHAMEASIGQLKHLQERCWGQVEILVIPSIATISPNITFSVRWAWIWKATSTS